ncbi:aspartyl-tRNA synthetase [Infirmifilum uzonense]|uniref:Aspartate--tRNA ligase n=1 Tax=Infirmifilum uzonense TaxID=1550241 RepID=A0A0F7FI73_9CREN|nr:aspartate--tRNA(Asn) ligase [Infirmifilum uzonense]AKG38885.1 aspartyl-tRNA synthetase [Infirmifilum uzonense]
MSEKAGVVEGWVSNVKTVGKITFIEVIDDLSISPVTVVVKRDSVDAETWSKASSMKIGSAVRVEGVFPDIIVSRKGRELQAKAITVLSEPIELPPIDLTGKTPASFDLYVDFRYLALRLPRFRAVFIARAKLVEFTREFFAKNGFLEVHTPKLVGAGAEGGATLFTVDYFGQKAYLSQSPQLYKQMLMCGVPRVFEITPYFRAEKFSTPRHLNESWGLDVEMGFIEDEEDVMKVLEEFIGASINYLRMEVGDMLKTVGLSLIDPPSSIPRITYSEIIDILNSIGYNIQWGEDLDTQAEKSLGEYLSAKGTPIYFITKYPWDAKPFYIMREGDNLSKSFDLDIKGIEVASGGQREHRYHELVQNLKAKGLSLEEFSFYIKAFMYGMPPHGGFGLGLDRLLMTFLGLSNIREVVLFPRDRFRLIP